MNDILVRIKRAVLDGRYEFSEKAMRKISICPTCRSRRLKSVQRTITRCGEGETYTVPNLAFHECPDCGERLYDRDAMRKIEAHSPAYAKPHATR